MLLLFMFHVDTGEVKYDLSDPETPEEERKNVFGGNYSPTCYTLTVHQRLIIANDISYRGNQTFNGRYYIRATTQQSYQWDYSIWKDHM